MLYSASDGRTVVSNPKRRKIGWAQWCPARVEILVRITRLPSIRHRSTIARRLRKGRYTLDHEQMTLSIGTSEVTLTRAEHAVLTLFFEHPDTVFTRAELLDRCWKRADAMSPLTINTFICRMRKKLGQQGPQITTVRSLGYRFSTDDDLEQRVGDDSWSARRRSSVQAA